MGTLVMPDVVPYRHLVMSMGNAWRLCRPRDAVFVVDSPLAPLHWVTGSGKLGKLRGHVRGSICLVKASTTAFAASSSAAALGPARDHNILRDVHKLLRLLGAVLTLCLLDFALLARHQFLL